MRKGIRMNEQAFTYEHLDNLSYIWAALAVMYSLMVLFPMLAAPHYILLGPIYAIICASVFLYRFIRAVRSNRKYESLSPKKRMQMIKRHRFSPKWIIPLGIVSIAISVFCAMIFNLSFIQIMGVWGLSLMVVAFLGLRVFLYGLKSQMTAVEP